MKKKKLKLSLKKNVISNLQATAISGGYDTSLITMDKLLCPFPPTNIPTMAC